MVRLTRTSLIATGVTALLAALATSFAGLQWKEAHDGGAVSKAQADAAVKLAAVAERQMTLAEDQIALARSQTASAAAQAGALRDSVTIAEKGVSIAADQVEINRSSAMQQNRPYLNVGMKSILGDSLGKRPIIIINIANPSGHTALRVTTRFTSLLSDQHATYEQLVRNRAPNPPTSLPPGSNFDVTLDHPAPLSGAELESIKAQRIQYYVAGLATYEDSYGQKHAMHYCSQWKYGTDEKLIGKSCPRPEDY